MQQHETHYTPTMLPSLPSKATILGIGVSITTYSEVTEHIVQAAQAQQSLLVNACSVHNLIAAMDDASLAAVLNHIDINAPDGQPVRWGLHWTGQASLRDRVYGPTLMLHACEAAARARLPVYLYGSREATLSRLAERLRARFPALQIAGQRAGRFRPLSEQEAVLDARDIAASGARIVFVGMGCPKQDFWIFHMRERIPLPLIAVGAAFDFHAGLVPQAPPIMQRNGLEWLYRLTREPTRLWRRYLTITPRYLPLIAQQTLGLRSFPIHTDVREAETRPCPG
jgi:N-acetylglucosaminyldiphosphoundecaprenol N-acetyl-beta-D-mannosaminyltransferase